MTCLLRVSNFTIGTPDEWLAENMAHLLILCGDGITSKMLISKAINGRMLELSSLTTSFCVVSIGFALINNFYKGYPTSIYMGITC